MPKTILVVDDSVMILRIVGQIIKELGYNVLLAQNGEIGYNFAKDSRPDLVIMDIEMPVMDGIEATARITSDEATASIPVVMFTSLGREEDKQNAIEAGCSGFLNKPVCKEELHDAIKKFIGE